VILTGDCREMLAALPAESVQTCVTSPPYFGLRDYGHAGQIGLESSPAEFVEQLVEVFRAVRRVLRDDGTLWLNLGDSYAATTKGSSGVGKNATNVGTLLADRSWRVPPGLKAKDLIGIPWRVAFALQSDGWYLRQDIIWHKPNPMPESVRDRCTKAHEYVFLLSKSERYFYDADAVSEPLSAGTIERLRSGPVQAKKDQPKNSVRGDGGGEYFGGDSRNRRSVWSITSEPYPEAHFATFPSELPRLCILAGSKVGDTVLDPFAGSGTTLQVALELGRQAIGCELNPAYVELINRRLARTTLGLPLEAA
jgi:DNA modification methylase